jgi:hypothetical protein
MAIARSRRNLACETLIFADMARSRDNGISPPGGDFLFAVKP